MPRLRLARWSDKDTATVIAMYEKNKSYEEIANALNRTTRATEEQCTRLRAAGLISPRPVKHPIWTDEMYDTLERLWVHDGLTGQKCADVLGVTRSAVLGAVRRRKLHRNADSYTNRRGFKLEYETPEQRIRRWHEAGSSLSDIARNLAVKVSMVEEKMIKMGLTPHRNPPCRTTYNVHPMWGMPDEERRLEFYQKFRRGLSIEGLRELRKMEYALRRAS